MKITSTEPRSKYDFRLQDWAEIPLDHLSTIQPSQVTRIRVEDIKYYAGYISDVDWEEALTRYEQYIQERTVQ